MKFTKRQLRESDREDWGKWVAWGIIVTFGILYAVLAIVRHERFLSLGYDLGLYDQALWLYSRFLLPFSTVKVPAMVVLGDHFAPSFALLSPLYWLWQDVRVLLIAQAVLVSLSAVPLYLIARKVIADKYFPLALAVAYLLFFGIQNALAFDVHMITFAAALLPWLFYALDFRRFKLYWLLFFIALGFKEDVSVVLFTVGIYTILRYRYLRLALASMVISFVYPLFVLKIAIPYFSGGFLYASVIPTSVSGIIDVFVPLSRWVTAFYSLASFSFLPLFNFSAVPMITGHFLLHWLDPKFFGRWEMGLHYRVILGPMLAMAAIWGARKIGEVWGAGGIRVVGVVLIMIVLVLQWRLHLPLNSLFKTAFYQEEEWMRQAREIIKLVPKGASVATQNNFIPHLSQRREIYPLWSSSRVYLPLNKPCFPARICLGLDLDRAEYILVDSRVDQPPVAFWGMGDTATALARIKELEESGDYNLIAQKGTVKLLRRTKK